MAEQPAKPPGTTRKPGKTPGTAQKKPTAKRVQEPVIPESGLFTGLVDYGMWVQMFQDRSDEPSIGFRRGRIWA
ncbi:cyanobactin biosynthesis PatC/TenC/TruC family protein [Streptomyces sp. 1222.5]|uniref:cyanobactin biosynthesis PatC/TenC/TruC family protein n=1 Tax=Streptomyces sp. 1222.5 TaxID=1881026 RepID=UPI003D713A51